MLLYDIKHIQQVVFNEQKLEQLIHLGKFSIVHLTILFYY